MPARGGSKGIVKKNITPFLGNPLIAYTIEQAKASETVDEVFVSTDSEEIAAVSREWGASVIERPPELARDESATEPALRHAVDVLRDRGHDPSPTVLLQCTSPMRRKPDIDDTVSYVKNEAFDSALTCCEDHSFYWTDGPSGAEPVNYDPENRQRRQDMDRRYRENGSVYVTDTQLLLDGGSRLGGEVAINEMPKSMSLEIDTPEDLRMTEAVARDTDFYTGDAEIVE